MTSKTDPAQLRYYLDAAMQLLPLHHHDHFDDHKGKHRDRGKSPVDANWTKRAYRNADQVEHMRGGDNVGVRLRACDLVVDVDPRNFPLDPVTGERQTLATPDNPFDRLCQDAGLKPTRFPTVFTGSGGLHVYMTKPDDVSTRDSLPAYEGVEFKTLGRQVVAAGSVHPATKRVYLWDATKPELDVFGPDAAPATLLGLIARPDGAAPTGGGEHDQELLATMLDRLDPEDFRDQARWFTLMQACHHATAGDGRQEFVEWSTRDAAFADDGELIGRRWDSLHADNAGTRVTVKTLHKFLVDAGAEDAVPRASAADDFDAVSADEVPVDLTERVRRGASLLPAIHEGGLQVHPKTSVAPDNFANALKAVSKSGLQPRFDELKQRVVLTGDLPWGKEYGRVLDDKVLMLARTWLMQRLQGNDYQPSKDNVLEALTTVGFYYKFNPIIDYLDGQTWDGTPRVASLFGRGFQCGRDDYTEAVSRCFMVGAVARQRDPGCKFDTMPVVNGPQGTLKSSGFRVLFSAEWFSDAEMGDLRHKDAPMNLEGIWLHEFAELAGLRAGDMNVLKAFMSRAVDRYRSPYGRATADHPRRSVFSGSVNGGGYLGDPTGARRFWPMTMKAGTRVDLDWIGANRDQLWAEADAMFKAGTSAVLPERLWAMAAELQAEETVEDPWGDQVAEMLRRRAELRADFEAGSGDFAPETVGGREVASPLDEPPWPERVHTQELLAHLGLGGDRQSHAHAQRLRRVMEARGWRYRRSVRVGARVAAGYVLGEG